MFVALRDLRFAKGRFALMGAVVMLITLLVTMLSGLTAGLAADNTSALNALPADRLVFATPGDTKPSFNDSRISGRTLEAWKQVPGTAVEPLGIIMGRVAFGDRGASAAVFGVESGGLLAREAVTPGRIVLSAELASETGLRAGDKVQFAGRDFTVSGMGPEASHSHAPVAWISIDDWRAAVRQGESAPAATVLAVNGGSSADLEAADSRLGTTAVPLGEARSALPAFSSENGSLQLMRGFLFAISALVIGAFFTVWTIQRQADIAVLKALGAGTGYLLRDALAQAGIVLLAGAGAGGLLGAAGGLIAGRSVPFVTSAPTTVLPVTIMIVLGAAGAALAVRKITSVDPLTALGATR